MYKLFYNQVIIVYALKKKKQGKFIIICQLAIIKYKLPLHTHTQYRVCAQMEIMTISLF